MVSAVTRPVVPTLDALADPVIAVDRAGTLRYANQRASQVLSWDREALMHQSVLDLVHPDDLNLALASLDTITTKDVGDIITMRARTGLGEWIYLEIRGAPQAHDGDELIVLVARDVTDRHRHDFDQGDVGMLRAVMANMHGMVLLVDAGGRIRSINGAVTRMLGHDPELVRGRSFLNYVHPDDRSQVIGAFDTQSGHDSLSMDARFIAHTGAYVVCEFTVNDLLDDPVVGSYVVSAQVATALSDARDRVEFLAEHDSRTGLLNRDGFMRAVQELIATGDGLGLMLIDVAQFRSINELYGEPVGDAVLATIGERIDQIRWPELVTARLGGDEFVMAVRSTSDAAIEMLRERVRRDVALPIVVDDHEVNIGLRTATAWERRPRGLESLLATASNELMSIKRNAVPDAGGISYDAISERRQQLEQLRQALANGEIQPFYQPIVSPDGTIRAVEALVRWVHPLRGVLGVGEILPLAQMAGLAEAVDDCVLERALEFAVRLNDLGHREIEVHVNIDPKVIAQPAFGATFLDRCTRAGVNPAQLVVEITETDLLAPGARSLANMQKLRFAGIHVSIDDFGTGYSSLAHLLELPVDGVKIDRRFVAGIDVDPAATNLTTAILGLSESLRLSCVAEGVEQHYQRERLVEMGCPAFQGWLFSAAVPADELLAMLPRIDLAAADEPSHVRTA